MGKLEEANDLFYLVNGVHYYLMKLRFSLIYCLRITEKSTVYFLHFMEHKSINILTAENILNFLLYLVAIARNELHFCSLDSLDSNPLHTD